MKEKNMTALVSCFSRCYHFKNNSYRIFNDSIAEKILSTEEYNSISNSMANGIKFFNPRFLGTKEEALKWIVNNQLSPSVLGRSIFCEDALANAINIGCRQYLIFASGYDTYAYRNKIENLDVFEIDKKEVIEDKIRRLNDSGIDYSKVNFIECDFKKENWIDNILNSKFNKNVLSFCSLLGIVYYLTKEEFSNMIKNISSILCNGCTIVFDYPSCNDSRETRINESLANEADEQMKAKYSYLEVEKILLENGFLIYEHLDYEAMNKSYFYKYNILNPNDKVLAPQGVCYCLAVKNIKQL